MQTDSEEMMMKKIAALMPTAQDVTCENCGNYTFQQVALLKRISAIVSPNGKELLVPNPVFACNACGFVNKQFVPPTMAEEREEEQQESPVKPRLVLEK